MGVKMKKGALIKLENPLKTKTNLPVRNNGVAEPFRVPYSGGLKSSATFWVSWYPRRLK